MSTITAPVRSPATSSAFGFRAEPDRRAWVEGQGTRRASEPGRYGRRAGRGPRGIGGTGGRRLRRRGPRVPRLAGHAGARSGPRALPLPRDCWKKHFLDIAKGIVRENGKLLSEAKGSLRRGIDGVEYACGIPAQLLGQTLNDVRATSIAVNPRAGRRRGRHPAVQLSGHDPAVDDAGRRGLRQCVHPEAGGEAPLTGTRLVELFAEAGLPAAWSAWSREARKSASG